MAHECRQNGDGNGEDVWHNALEVACFLGPEGMSEEEDVICETKEGNRVTKKAVKAVKAPVWRHPATASILHAIDKARREDESTFGKRGRVSFERVASQAPSSVPARKNMLRALYNPEWLATLREDQVEKLEIDEQPYVLHDIVESA